MRNNLLLIPAALLIIAILPLPYGYYTLLRLVVTIGASAVAWLDYQETKTAGPWVLVFGMTALLFNPLIPVYLSRNSWFFLDIAAAAIFTAKWFVSKQKVA
jgi:hypothetical protein